MRWRPMYEQLQAGKAIDLDFQCVMSVLSPEECETVIGMSATVDKTHSSIVWGDHEENVRDTDLFFLHPNDSNNWLFERIAGAVGEINKTIFEFDLDGSIHGFQLGRYGVGQGYDWHADLGALAPRRKLSVSIQLTAPSKYEGGSLEFFRTETQSAHGWSELGSMTVFPSWLLHRVSRVSQGERWSLVTWLEGSPFR